MTNRNLVSTFVVNDLRGRYLGSFVGFFGYIINPLILFFVYCFVFSGILKIKFGLSEGMGNFAVYLFCGLVPWLGFSEAVQRSSSLMLDQRALIKRVFLPKVIFPLSLTISTFLVQIATLLVYLVVIYFLKYECRRTVLLLPLIFPIQILFTFGFCLLVSSLNVFFRDIGVFVGTLLTLWFFCTPIFYPESIIPERFVPFMDINPMLHLVRIYRHLILGNELPAVMSIIYFIIISVLVFCVGSYVFKKLEDKFVDHL